MEAQRQHITKWMYELLTATEISALKYWMDKYQYYWTERRGVLSAVIDESRRDELIDYMAAWGRIIAE